jgi:hypothetical protein
MLKIDKKRHVYTMNFSITGNEQLFTGVITTCSYISKIYLKRCVFLYCPAYCEQKSINFNELLRLLFQFLIHVTVPMF